MNDVSIQLSTLDIKVREANLAVTHTPAVPSRLSMPPITLYIGNREIGNITRNR